jgi:hypothetical protein
LNTAACYSGPQVDATNLNLTKKGIIKMRIVKSKNPVIVLCCMVLWLSLITACVKNPYAPKPFPVNKVENAKVTYNFNAEGLSFVTDQDGIAIPSKGIPFETIVKKAKKEDPDWIRVFGSYTIYRSRVDKNVWLCSNSEGGKCIEGNMDNEKGGAVLSLNYDGERLFFGNAKGHEEKNLRSLSSLLHKMDFSRKTELEVFNTFVIYRVKGSQLWLDCSGGICRCKCVDTNTWAITECNHLGQCN